MDRESFEFAVSNFISLEEQLSNCLEYIPYSPNNVCVVSPKFIPIILESCSLIDSIFFSLADDKSERYNLKRYMELFEPAIGLENNITLLLSTPIRGLIPFKDWTTKQPDWWVANNSLKHDRLDNHQCANMTNAVLALAALHQVMTRVKHFVGSFLRAGWIDTSDMETIVEIGSVANLGALHPSPPNIVVESKLFASATRNNFVISFDEYYFEIDYDMNGISNRLRNMITAHEDWYYSS
jgi:hypothetical protein